VQGITSIAHGRLEANSDIALAASNFRFTGIEYSPNVTCTCMPRTHAAVLRWIRRMIDQTDPQSMRVQQGCQDVNMHRLPTMDVSGLISMIPSML